MPILATVLSWNTKGLHSNSITKVTHPLQPEKKREKEGEKLLFNTDLWVILKHQRTSLKCHIPPQTRKKSERKWRKSLVQCRPLSHSNIVHRHLYNKLATVIFWNTKGPHSNSNKIPSPPPPTRQKGKKGREHLEPWTLLKYRPFSYSQNEQNIPRLCFEKSQTLGKFVKPCPWALNNFKEKHTKENPSF